MSSQQQQEQEQPEQAHDEQQQEQQEDVELPQVDKVRIKKSAISRLPQMKKRAEAGSARHRGSKPLRRLITRAAARRMHLRAGVLRSNAGAKRMTRLIVSALFHTVTSAAIHLAAHSKVKTIRMDDVDRAISMRLGKRIYYDNSLKNANWHSSSRKEEQADDEKSQ